MQEQQLDTLRAAMIEDFNIFMSEDTEIQKNMRAQFAEGIQFKSGKKYIKVTTGHAPGDQARVWGFIVNTDDDKKFRKGDILKAAGWSTPARNKPRGNILDGGYHVLWTGPRYL